MPYSHYDIIITSSISNKVINLVVVGIFTLRGPTERQLIILLCWSFSSAICRVIFPFVNAIILKGLSILGHILLSDKNPRRNVTKTHEGALQFPRVFWPHVCEGFVRQQYMTRND